MSPDDLLFYFGVPGHPRVFMLGCTEPRVTVHDQQVRAANLIWALADAKLVRRGQRIGIVGGGFAGVTAAMAAKLVGWQPVIFDRYDQACKLHERSARWIHPRLYDWPAEGWDSHQHALPFCEWAPGPVSSVVAKIREQLKREGLSIAGSVEVKDVVATPSVVTVACEARQRFGPAPALRTPSFPVVIIAVGFGVEPNPSYWDSDDLDEDKGPRHCAVAGMGDGALIDAARLRLSPGDYFGILQDLAEKTPPSVRKQLGALERVAKNQARGGASPESLSKFLHDGTRRIIVNNDDALQSVRETLRLRNDTKVDLVAPLPHPHMLSASPLNRWIIALLTAWDDNFSYFKGRLVGRQRSDGDTHVQLPNHRIHLRTGTRRVFPPERDADLPQPWVRPFHEAMFDAGRRSVPGLDGPRRPQWPDGFWAPPQRDPAREKVPVEVYFAVKESETVEVFELMPPSFSVLVLEPKPWTESGRYDYVERRLREHGDGATEIQLFRAEIEMDPADRPRDSRMVPILDLDTLIDIRRYER